MYHFVKSLGSITAIIYKEVQKGAPTEGATALKPHPPLFKKNRVMSMYRFNRMGHDQCVATTLREHNDLKDSAGHIQLNRSKSNVEDKAHTLGNTADNRVHATSMRSGG